MKKITEPCSVQTARSASKTTVNTEKPVSTTGSYEFLEPFRPWPRTAGSRRRCAESLKTTAAAIGVCVLGPLNCRVSSLPITAQSGVAPLLLPCHTQPAVSLIAAVVFGSLEPRPLEVGGGSALDSLAKALCRVRSTTRYGPRLFGSEQWG